MASREEPPKRFRTETEPTSAPGGHLSSGEEAGGPLFDPLFAPLPSELAGEPGLKGGSPRSRGGRPSKKGGAPSRVEPVADQPQPWEETELLPPRRRPERDMTPRPRPRPAPGSARKRARVPMRRSKRTITHVHPVSVLKLSLFMYSCFFVVWLFIAAVLYNLIAATGVLEAIAEIINVFGTEGQEFEVTFGVAMKWAIILGLVGVIVGSLVNAALAFLYNVANDVVGGVQLTFSDRDE